MSEFFRIVVIFIPIMAVILLLAHLIFPIFSGDPEYFESPKDHPTENSRIRDSKFFSTQLLIMLFLTSVGGIIMTYVIYVGGFSFSKDPAHWGQFGDYIGGTLNPLIGLASLTAIIYAVRLQIKQLTVSREELSATRIELEASRKAQEDTSRSLQGQLQNLRVQQFESTFFKLVESLRHSIVKVEVDINTLISHVLNAPKIKVGGLSKGSPMIEPSEINYTWKDARVRLQKKESSGFYLMANSIRSALGFIKHSEADLSQSPQFYVEQVLNCLTSDMLRLLVVWCSNDEENEFSELVVRYNFFANLRMQSDDTLGHGLPISELALDMKAFEFKESFE